MQRRLIIPLFAMSITLLACGANNVDTQATVEAAYARLTAEAQAGEVETDKGADATAPPDDATAPPTEADPVDPTDRPTPSPSPTPPDARTPELGVPPCANEIVIDADAEDWEGQDRRLTITLNEATFGQGQWTGPADASGEVSLCWTPEALYLLAEVVDDIHVQNQTGARAYQGDEIELSFDGNLRGDYYAEQLSDDDRQLGLSPGDFDELPPAAVAFTPSFDGDIPVELTARQPIGSGGNYTLEAAIEWAALRVRPQADTTYGLCVNISDNDQVGEASQDSYITHCADLDVFDPTTYATIRLEP